MRRLENDKLFTVYRRNDSSGGHLYEENDRTGVPPVHF